MALFFVRCALLSVALAVLVAKPAAAADCVGETYADDDDDDDDVTLVQLAFRKPVRALVQQVDEDEEISNLLQNTVQAQAQRGKTDPEVESAAPSSEEDLFLGQWHDDHGSIATITRENASWYRMVTDDPAEPNPKFCFRVNGTHIEMNEHDEVFQGELQEGNHHMHWHRGFGHEEWQKVGFEEEDTRWMHGSHYDAEHPLVDYEVTPEDMMHVTAEEFFNMEEHNESIASLAEHDIDEHIARHDGSVPELVPVNQPHYDSPSNSSNGGEAPSTPLSSEGDPASSHLFSKAVEDEEPQVPFAESEAVARLRQAFERTREVMGEEDMSRGYEKIVQAIERRGQIKDSDVAAARSDDPNRVVRALEVLTTKMGRSVGERLATGMAAMMLQKVDEAKATMDRGGV